jgi:hypothetical protein
MSKDKGQKNQKKAPADNSSGTKKEGSSYKNEGKKSGQSVEIDAFQPKAPSKSGKKS